MTHQLRDAFYVARAHGRAGRRRDRDAPAPPDKVEEADFVMLRDGRIMFEGSADELQRSTDPYLKRFSPEVPFMPRTRSLAWSELKIGILAVFALVMAAVLIFAVGGRAASSGSIPAQDPFPNVAGLKQRLAGARWPASRSARSRT